MRKRKRWNEGWRPFWAALGATLLVLLPLAGGTVLLTRRTARARLQTAESQSGIAVRLPRADERLTLLLCTAPGQEEVPGFLLLYLNAEQNSFRLLAVPAQTAVTFGEGEATLAECYAAAGPARCRETLTELLALPEDTHYLALSPAVLERIADRYGTVRVSFSGALTAEELEASGLSGAVQGLSAREAREILSALDAAGSVPPAHRAAARAAVWDAFFRQNLELLPTTLPQALRDNSSSLLTDLAAQDYLLLEETLEFLANNAAAVSSDTLPGETDDAGHYVLTDASRAAVQTLFNVAPTAGQAESGSEP